MTTRPLRKVVGHNMFCSSPQPNTVGRNPAPTSAVSSACSGSSSQLALAGGLQRDSARARTCTYQWEKIASPQDQSQDLHTSGRGKQTPSGQSPFCKAKCTVGQLRCCAFPKSV